MAIWEIIRKVIIKTKFKDEIDVIGISMKKLAEWHGYWENMFNDLNEIIQVS